MSQSSEQRAGSGSRSRASSNSQHGSRSSACTICSAHTVRALHHPSHGSSAVSELALSALAELVALCVSPCISASLLLGLCSCGSGVDNGSAHLKLVQHQLLRDAPHFLSQSLSLTGVCDIRSRRRPFSSANQRQNQLVRRDFRC